MKLPIYRRYTEERSEDVESHSEALAPEIQTEETLSDNDPVS